MSVIHIKSEQVPGVVDVGIKRVNPYLEAFNPNSGSAFKIYEQVYQRAVRLDGQCTREWVLEERTFDHKVILEGYETKEQAEQILTGWRGKHFDLVIFGDHTTRVGRGVSDGMISRA